MTDDLEKYIANKMIKSIEEETSNNLFGSFSTHTNIKPEPLTIEKFQEIIYFLYPKLYYATSKHIQKGQMYICKETDYNPEYIIFHPDDFEHIKDSFKKRTLVHIKDEPKEDKMKRLLKNLTIYPININIGE